MGEEEEEEETTQISRLKEHYTLRFSRRLKLISHVSRVGGALTVAIREHHLRT